MKNIPTKKFRSPSEHGFCRKQPGKSREQVATAVPGLSSSAARSRWERAFPGQPQNICKKMKKGKGWFLVVSFPLSFNYKTQKGAAKKGGIKKKKAIYYRLKSSQRLAVGQPGVQRDPQSPGWGEGDFSAATGTEVSGEPRTHRPGKRWVPGWKREAGKVKSKKQSRGNVGFALPEPPTPREGSHRYRAKWERGRKSQNERRGCGGPRLREKPTQALVEYKFLS